MAHPQRKTTETGAHLAQNRTPRGVPAEHGRVAAIEIFDDLAAAEPAWRRLENVAALKSPYQSFDFLSLWQRHIGATTGVSPCVVVGYDGNGPAFLWPLGRTQFGPLKVLGFLGGKHANFNFPLWRPDFLATVGADEIRSVVDQIATARIADILLLARQPRSWEGIANPLSLLPHQPSPSESLRLTITAQGEDQIKEILSSTMRGQLRSKERRLQKLMPGYRYIRATTAAEIDRLLEGFFPLKAAHMKAQSLPNTFGDPRHEAFLREACHQKTPAGQPLVDIHALEDDKGLIAIFGAINDGRRSSGMFNTYTLGDASRQSPGLVLLVHTITDISERGVRTFDLGVGEAKYKTIFCKEPEPLFDSFLPLTAMGQLAAVAARAGGHIKRKIKQSDALRNLIGRLRQTIPVKS